MAKTFIYAIHCPNKNEVKIGYATDPIKRLAQLQTATTDRLDILLTFSGNIEVEKLLHNRLEKFRLGGEWFIANSVVLKTILEFAALPLNDILSNDLDFKATEYVEKVVTGIISGTKKSRITVGEVLKNSTGLDKKFVGNALVTLGWERKAYKSKNVVYIKKQTP